ncbi:MAG TPA: hypothetical protein VM938_05880 [Acidimicrobiales bacterium]|nr:hypothetical protein [Acidimicrobiales bacterium]
MEHTFSEIEAWRESLRGETYISPSRAQDRLFTLWGGLQDTPAARLVEQWLTLSISRDLFSGAELIEFLDELEAYLKLHPSTSPVSH